MMGDYEVYYRIKYDAGEYIVCSVQWFDECDYDQSSMLNLKFENEMAAKQFAEVLNRRQDIGFVYGPKAE